MSRLPLFVSTLLVAALLAGLSATAQAEGDWKRGRIYYRAVCTDCHQAKLGHAISPATKTKAEWADYLNSAKGGEHVAQWVSQAHRQSIAGENKVAAKFVDVPDAELLADIQAFVLHGAKDSDTPARCN